MRAASTSRRSWRAWPLVVSALVAGAAALGHRAVARRLQEGIDARDARLLALPERALRGASGADSGLARAVTRDGEELSVSVRVVATGAEVARYRVSLRQMLADIPLGREAFDLLLVADDRGAVAAQQGDETLARNSLDGLAVRDGSALTAARLWAAASLSAVRINARDYVLACRPVGLPHRTAAAPDGEAGRAGLLFCGIASEDRRRREALDGAAEAVAGLWAVAAAVLLALPLVKLLLAGAQDPVRAADVRALGACSGLALLALGAAALAVPVTRSLSARSDAALSSVASTARRNLEIEIDRLRRQAAELDRRALGQPPGRSCANVLALFGAPAVGCPALPVGALDYPYFASMSWASENGDQVARWRTTPPDPGARPAPDGLLSIAARDYFRAVRDDRLWPVGGDRAGGERAPFYIQSIRSLSTGRPGAALSIPSAGLGQPLMAAVTTRLLSVWDPVLPPDVGLAVVDRDGEVLFHSNPAQSLTHNLLAETTDDGRLRAAVSGSSEVVASARYWGRRHLFATAPLREVPWSIVAFRDEAPAREAVAEVARSGLALALAYAAVVGGLSWLALALGDRRGARGPWPRPDRRSAYVEAIATLAVFAAAWLLALRTAPPERAVWLAFAAPFAALALLAVAFRTAPLARVAAAVVPAAWRRRADASSARFTGALHATALGLAAVCVAVLPGISLAQAAAGRVLQDFAARERRALQARTAARSESAAVFHGHLLRRDRGTTQEGAATPDGQLLRARLQETLDLYPARVFAEEDAGGDGTGPHWFGATPRAAPAGAPTGATGGGVLLLGVGAALLVRWTTRRVLPDSVRPEPRSYDDLRQGRVASAVCLLPSGSDVDRALQGGWCRRIDVREGVGEADADPSRPAAIDLRGFAEAREDARAATRAFAEALCDDRRRRVYLVGFRPAADLLHPPDGGAPPLSAGEADAWRRLFERLETVVVRDVGEASASRDEQSAHRLLGLAAGRARVRFLAEELRAAPRLRGLADRQLAPGSFTAQGRASMVARLAEIAEDYYADLWGACAADERRVLADVCAGTFVSGAQRDAAGRALDRGLAIGDPVVRPMNRSFAAFVLRQEVPAPEPSEARRARWQDARLPLLVLAASCGALAWLLHAAPLGTALGLVAALPG